MLSVYFQVSSGREQKIQSTRNHLAQLSQEILAEQLLQQELLEREKSFTDPAYLELVLMDKMGVVPGGQQKVTFKPVP